MLRRKLSDGHAPDKYFRWLFSPLINRRAQVCVFFCGYVASCFSDSGNAIDRSLPVHAFGHSRDEDLFTPMEVKHTHSARGASGKKLGELWTAQALLIITANYTTHAQPARFG